MRTKPPPLLPIFRSEAQARLLALLLLDPERRWPGPELQRRLEIAEPTFRREIGRLVDAGLVAAESLGRTKLYAAAIDSPLYEPLRELVERTFGVETELARALADVDGVEAAAIFGSWAEEKLGPTSDIDLLVIGDAEFDKVSEAVRPAEELAGREIHLVVYGRDEFEEKRTEGSGFVQGILRGPLKLLIGEVA